MLTSDSFPFYKSLCLSLHKDHISDITGNKWYSASFYTVLLLLVRASIASQDIEINTSAWT